MLNTNNVLKQNAGSVLKAGNSKARLILVTLHNVASLSGVVAASLDVVALFAEVE